MPRPRTVVIGLDGGTWELLSPALEHGRLPRTRKALEGAVTARLESVDPPVTLPAWYCAFTGASPARLDCWGFTTPSSTPGRFESVTDYRPWEAIWDRLSRRGSRVAVVNAPVLPPPVVHGVFVPGMLEFPGGRPVASPSGLLPRLEKEVGPWAFDLPGRGGSSLEDWLGLAVSSLTQKASAAELLADREDPEFLFVLLSETDRVQHEWYPDLLASVVAAGPPWDRYWEGLDRTVSRLIALRDSGRGEGWAWILSDHGFGPAEGYFFTNRFLEREGFLALKVGAPRGRSRLTGMLSQADRLVPLRAPLAWVERGRRASPTSRPPVAGGTDLTFGEFAPHIDWERTRAFSFPTPEAIFENRYRSGPAEDRDRLAGEILDALGREPRAELRGLRPEELYSGPLGPRAPLLLLVSHGYAWETRGDFNYSRTLLARRPSYFRRKGTHRRTGLLAVVGPGVSPGPLGSPVSLLSFAPTLSRTLGLELPEPRDGGPDPALLGRLGVGPASFR